jgi:hypothetical protein
MKEDVVDYRQELEIFLMLKLDLQTEEIVTTKFRCSQFSSYHSKSDGFDWVSFFRPQNMSYYNLVPSRYSKFELINSELNAFTELHQVKFIIGHVEQLFKPSMFTWLCLPQKYPVQIDQIKLTIQELLGKYHTGEEGSIWRFLTASVVWRKSH